MMVWLLSSTKWIDEIQRCRGSSKRANFTHSLTFGPNGL